MPPVRPVSIRKKRTIEYGQKIARLKVGENLKNFAVHEDLLCHNSLFFRTELQGNRQEINGECSICHDEMEFGLEELTYCKTCGGNIHQECLEEWRERKPPAQHRTTCPLCRAQWESHDSNRSFTFPNLDPDGMATYIEWLYTRQISVEELDKEDPDEPAPDLQSLVEDYVTGIIIDDPDFSTALLEALLETIKNTGIHPSCTAIKIAYEKTSGPCGLRQLLVQTAAAAGGYITYERDDWDNHPSDFIKDLCTAVMKKRKVDDNWDLEAMSKKCKTAEEYKDYDEHQEDTGESEEGTKSENGATE